MTTATMDWLGAPEAPEVPALSWPEILPAYLSPSSLKTYMRCRESWRRRYLERAHEPSSHYFVWGGAHNHALVEVNYRQKITSGVDLPVEDVQLAFAESVDARVRDDNDGIEWGGTSPDAVKDAGVKLVTAYHTQVSPTVQPIAVEENVHINVPGCPIPLTGYLDVLTAERTIDLKTAAKRELSAADVFQGHVYQLARPLPVDFHIATKTKMPAVYTPAEYPEFGLDVSDAQQALTARMIVNLAADILTTLATYGADGPWPGAYTVRGTCGMCGYRASCAWWQA